MLPTHLRTCLIALFLTAIPSGTLLAVNTSGLPVPRFVTLRSDQVNLRTGPGEQYPIDWVFKRKNMPVEIVAEFKVWRKIRDVDGTEGWVYHSLLSGRRTGVVLTKSKDELVALHVKADAKSAIAAQLQPGVLATVKYCGSNWCRITGQGFEGFIPQERLWGVYPNEKVE